MPKLNQLEHQLNIETNNDRSNRLLSRSQLNKQLKDLIEVLYKKF